MSKSQGAVAAEVGLNRATLNGWLSGGLPESVEHFLLLSQLLGVSLDDQLVAQDPQSQRIHSLTRAVDYLDQEIKRIQSESKA